MRDDAKSNGLSLSQCGKSRGLAPPTLGQFNLALFIDGLLIPLYEGDSRTVLTLAGAASSLDLTPPGESPMCDKY